MARRIIRTDDPLGTRNAAAQAASESAALATMAVGMALGAMWPRQADAQNAGTYTKVPDNDVRQTDPLETEHAASSHQPAVTEIPGHAGIRDDGDAHTVARAGTHAASGTTPLPEIAAIGSSTAAISADARTETSASHDAVRLSADAGTEADSRTALSASHDAASSLLPSHTLLPSLFDTVSHVTDDLAGTVNVLTADVSATLAAATGQIGELLGPDGVAGHVTATLSDTLGDSLAGTQTIAQDLISNVAGIAVASIEPLSDILGAPSQPDAIAPHSAAADFAMADTIAVPVAAGFAPETIGGSVVDHSPTIDTAGLVPAEVTGLSLGFIGTSYADTVDPHDLSFSPLGGGLHGLV